MFLVLAENPGSVLSGFIGFSMTQKIENLKSQLPPPKNDPRKGGGNERWIVSICLKIGGVMIRRHRLKKLDQNFWHFSSLWVILLYPRWNRTLGHAKPHESPKRRARVREKENTVQVLSPVRYAFSWYKYVSLNPLRYICLISFLPKIQLVSQSNPIGMVVAIV